jgi:ERCC4-type nuclease
MSDFGPPLRWLLCPQENARFPFRLFIEHEPGRFLCYDVSDKWPGPGQSIFCIARPEADALPAVEPVDSCTIAALKSYGRKLTVILDRPNRKRSWFITLERKYKDDPARSYKQTFWITQASASNRRGGAYLSSRGKTEGLPIVRDTRERYGYRLPRHAVEKEALPVGDYALKDSSGEVVAVVERKTRDQFLQDIATLEVLRARLLEMTTKYRYAALVVEADYGDLVNPKKSRFYTAGLVADVIAELSSAFPGLQLAFCSNRKFAAEWVERYFTRIARLDAPPIATDR